MGNLSKDKQSKEAAIVGNTVLAAGWISVEDNLPPKNGRYLVTCDNHLYSPYVCVYSTEYGSQYHWNIPAGRVTHWMELPLPPACT